MVAKTHSMIAFASLLGATYYFKVNELTATTICVCLIFNTIGALLPDIDQASNKLWDMMPGGELVGKALGVFMKHRGISHSILGFFLMQKLIFWLTHNLFNESFVNTLFVYYACVIGYISHIVADGFTEEGIPLLFPIKLQFGLPPIKPWRIKTGGWFEKVIVMPIAVVVAFFFFSLLMHR